MPQEKDLEAVLSQKHDGMRKPICYASRTLQLHEKELWSIRAGSSSSGMGIVKHFRVYLYGHKCDVDTDHEAVFSLINHAHPSCKLAHWGLALQELDLMVLYQSGKLNQPADCLSRCLGNALNMCSQANVVASVQTE